jgi:hypothetical protein
VRRYVCLEMKAKRPDCRLLDEVKMRCAQDLLVAEVGLAPRAALLLLVQYSHSHSVMQKELVAVWQAASGTHSSSLRTPAADMCSRTLGSDLARHFSRAVLLWHTVRTFSEFVYNSDLSCPPPPLLCLPSPHRPVFPPSPSHPPSRAHVPAHRTP